MSPQVLVLSPPRTGTQSIAAALGEPGYGPVYHMKEVGKNSHQPLWIDLINKKAAGQPILRSDLEVILDRYQALADFPATIFAPELLAAYPEAKVLVVRRDIEAWIRSMRSTLLQPSEGKAPSALEQAYKELCWRNDFEANGRQFWERFYETVEAVLRREEEETRASRCVEYRVGEGWKKICGLVGREVPTDQDGKVKEFPRVDDWVTFGWKKGGGEGLVE